MLDISCRRVNLSCHRRDGVLTLNLLRFVTFQSAKHSVLFAGDAVPDTFNKTFGASSIIFGFSSSVLCLTVSLPVFLTGGVANLAAPALRNVSVGFMTICGGLTVSLMFPFTEWNWPVPLSGPLSEL